MAATAEQAAHTGLGAVDLDQLGIHDRVIGGTLLCVHIVAGTAFHIALTIQQKSLDGHNRSRGEGGGIRIRHQHWTALVINPLVFIAAHPDHTFVIEGDRM